MKKHYKTPTFLLEEELWQNDVMLNSVEDAQDNFDINWLVESNH